MCLPAVECHLSPLFKELFTGVADMALIGGEGVYGQV